MVIIADHSAGEAVTVSQSASSPPQLGLVKSPARAGPDFIIGETCREAVAEGGTETEMDKAQRKMCLKLNLHNSESEQGELQRRENGAARRTSVGGNSNGTSSVTRTPSSIPLNLVQQCLSASPSLARSPAMHEGFQMKDWKVERTPINTPDCADCLTAGLPPKLSDDEEEVEETDSVNSETSEPISKGSGTSSFLPSSVDVSECRPANPPAEEHLPSSAVATNSSALVKPPAGFTDSPVRNVPPEFSLAEAEEQLCPQSQSEVLVLEQEEQEEQPGKQSENFISEENTANTIATCQDVLTSQKYKSYNQENFASYHHPELVVCQRQGNFNKENLKFEKIFGHTIKSEQKSLIEL